MFLDNEINNGAVVLSNVDNARCLPLLRNFRELKLLSQIMKVLKISTVLIYWVSNVFVSQSIADSWLFGNSFESVWLTWEKACHSEYVIENLLFWNFLYYFKKLSAWNFSSKLLFSKYLNLPLYHDEKSIHLSFSVYALIGSKDTFL